MKHESGESALLYASANLSAKVVELEAQIAALNAKLARVRVAAISLPHPPPCDYHQSDVCTCGKAEILREVGHE